jgi:hypothetical protein
MIKVAKVLGCVIIGAVGFWLGSRGNPMGWFLMLAAAWLVVATIRGQAKAKGNSWFEFGGCGADGCGGDGCGGCGGCGD